MENACPANDRFTASTDFVRKPCHETANRTLSVFNKKTDNPPHDRHWLCKGLHQ